MAKLRHGFKTECENYARELREELNLPQTATLHGATLAELLEVPVHALSRFPGIPDEIKMRYLTERYCNEFSATVIRVEGRRHIIHNDFHSAVRQNSNIMHEVAHIVLRHPPTSPLNGAELRNYDSEVESEAKELSFALLVPKPAALLAVERFDSLADAAKHFGVSVGLLTYRVRITDANGWAKNRARSRR